MELGRVLDRADIERKRLKDEKIINEEMNEEQDLSKKATSVATKLIILSIIIIMRIMATQI
jgi:hypothetical protein